jgi:DNA-binding XRE family transcriptional regulator
MSPRQTIMAIEKGKYVPSTRFESEDSHGFEKSVDDIFKLEDTDW